MEQKFINLWLKIIWSVFVSYGHYITRFKITKIFCKLGDLLAIQLKAYHVINSWWNDVNFF